MAGGSIQLTGYQGTVCGGTIFTRVCHHLRSYMAQQSIDLSVTVI